jgi:hypothetical protein
MRDRSFRAGLAELERGHLPGTTSPATPENTLLSGASWDTKQFSGSGETIFPVREKIVKPNSATKVRLESTTTPV